MKRILFWLGMGLTVLAGGPAAAEGLPQDYWILGLGTGAGLPLSNISAPYQTAISGQLTLGYQFDRNLALYLTSQSSIFQTSVPDIALTEFTLIPTIRYAFGDFRIRPYLTGGPGYGLASAHFAGTTVSSSDFAAQAGLGVLFQFEERFEGYVEAKYTVVFDSATTSYLPIYAGIDFGL